MLQIFTDGGSRGNPGPSASAFVVYNGDKQIFQKYKFWGVGTNNEAEYKAVIIAHHWLSQHAKYLTEDNINFFLDSELVVRQLTGVYKIKDLKLINLAAKIKEYEKIVGVGNIKYFFVRREKNKVADALVNRALDEKS